MLVCGGPQWGGHNGQVRAANGIQWQCTEIALNVRDKMFRLTTHMLILAHLSRCSFFHEHALLDVAFDKRESSFAGGLDGEATTVNYKLLMASNFFISNVLRLH